VKFDVAFLATQPVAELVGQARLAETLGYDTLWMTDTHLVCRELWVSLAACALGTARMRLGPGVTVPHSRHATVTASAIATLDELSGGRAVIGLGTGGSAAQTMGLRLEDVGRVATLERLATSVRRLTRRQAVTLETGVEARLAWLPAPRPIPIYAAGSGPRMLETAGRVGDGVIVYAGTRPDVLRAGLAHVARGAAAAGRAPGDLDIAIWAPMSIGPDGARARDHARGRVAAALRHPLPVPFDPEDQPVVERLRRAYDAYQHAAADAAHRELVPDRLVDLMALAGTPAEVREQVRRVASVPEIGRVILFPQVPGEGATAREDILRMFAEEVMARL
jgi:5,10-methylenetetrahydromethanopterin reductase